MKRYPCHLECPHCESRLSLTTETGWIDKQTFTAVLCCPECRTNCGMSDDAVEIAHGPDEQEVMDIVMSHADDLYERLESQDED